MEQKLTKEMIKCRGWNDKMIKKLLPPPEEIRKPSRKIKYYLWKTDDVIKAETTDEFKSMKASYDSNREISMKAVRTKKEALAKKIDDAISNITIKYVPYDILKKMTIKSKQEWYYSNGDYDIIGDVDDATMKRWMINYIRHNLTAYDSVLFSTAGKTGISDEYIRYRNAVMNKIEEVYPELFVKNNGNNLCNGTSQL